VFTEKARDLVVASLDALTTPHGIDRTLESLHSSWSFRTIRATLERVQRLSWDTVTLNFRTNRLWPGFEAGQYTELTVEIDGVRHTRCYSMANAAGGGREIELTIKAQEEGRVSPWLREHACTGDVFSLSPPQGQFVLPQVRPDRLLLISGGSGITPVMSMLRTLCDEGHPGPITFLHYNYTAGSNPYLAELNRIASTHPNVNVVRAYTNENGRGELDGFFSREHIAAADAHYQQAETYVCGPAPLMNAVRSLYAEQLLEDRLHIEAFSLPEYEDASGDAAGTVSLSRAGVALPNDGRTLLAQAEAAGLNPASGCRMGICRTCTCRMKAGVVRNVVDGTSTSGPDVSVRLCVNVPVGDVTLEL
jgi:stearoyl-CoA 9-desaturase NADPH oxidoreductase